MDCILEEGVTTIKAGVATSFAETRGKQISDIKVNLCTLCIESKAEFTCLHKRFIIEWKLEDWKSSIPIAKNEDFFL